MEKIKLPKKDFKHLEKLFAALIPNYQEYPPQLHKSVAKRLIEQGYVEEVEIKSGMFSMICHRLTQYGHYVFCMNC